MRDDINVVILTGLVIEHQEVKYLTSGTAVLNAKIRTTTSYEKDNQRMETEAEIPLTLWGKSAERFLKDAPADSVVQVTGKVTNRKRQNQKTGGEFDNVGISVDKYVVMSRPPASDIHPQERTPPAPTTPPWSGGPKGDGLVDDLPF